MDTISQIALGAAVGEAVLGRRVGNKAPLWGAICGTIPDLDVLSTPFLPEVQQLAVHRGFTHSITFAILAAPLLGHLIARIYEDSAISWKSWAWLAFWAVFTHPLLDIFTMYGTQFWQPFSDYPVAIGSIFVIDPLYTLPLIVSGIAILFIDQNSDKRRWINFAALGISSAYLLLTMGFQANARNTFEGELARQNVRYESLFVAPTALNSMLWMGLADDGETVYAGLYSLLDEHSQIQFTPVAKRSELIDDLIDQPALERLMWFSRGYYMAEQQDDDIYFNDLRFGRSDYWMNEQGGYFFRFRLLFDADNPGSVPDFHREAPDMRFEEGFLERFWNRIKGIK